MNIAMEVIPFKRFIIAQLFFNKDADAIKNKLKQFNYKTSESDIVGIFNEAKSQLPKSIISLLDSRDSLKVSNEKHVEWLKYFGIFEVYHYMVSSKTEKEKPEYFKWCEDCVWIHSYEDTMSLVNIFMYNEESLESISNIISFKFKKKIGVNALLLYKKIFWDTDGLDSKSALKCCLPFSNNVLVLKNIKKGHQLEYTTFDKEYNDVGSDVNVLFHDNNYIKWKIGYNNIEVPSPKTFLENVKRDSAMKYYEAMNMTQFAEFSEDVGNNELGPTDSKLKRFKNTEESRAKLAKSWFDMYVKAEEKLPRDNDGDQEFFDTVQQLELVFEDSKDKIVSVDDVKDMIKDIKEDFS